MTPSIWLVADEHLRGSLSDALRRRYGADYEVIEWDDPGTGGADLARLDEEKTELAAILAPLRTVLDAGNELFDEARRLHPGARRIGILDIGDVLLLDQVRRALTLGQIEMYFGQPWASPEEELYPVINEALRGWARAHRARFEKASIVDARSSPRGSQLRTWLERNGVVCTLSEPESAKGQDIIARSGQSSGHLPIVELFDGRVLTDPQDDELAEALSARTHASRTHYDLVIVGGGPAGLAAATYASSDGVRTAIIEHEAWGGQAGTSSRIRNYLGFPWGISGADLAECAKRQAEQLGAEYVVARSVSQIRSDHGALCSVLSNGEALTSGAIIIATGVNYRLLGVSAVDDLVGAGVFYGAAVSEAQAMGGLDVIVLGGGNSAGQAAVHLASAGARVTIVIRGRSLTTSMSAYLIEELEALPNVKVRAGAQVVDAGGSERLQHLELRDTSTGVHERVRADALFVFIGAVPNTQWLKDSVAVDEHGFVLTGADTSTRGPTAWALERPPAWLETSMPGVFAAGDVRHGSTKRVAAAVGEGSSAAMLVGCHLER